MSHSDGRATGASRTAGSHHFASPSLALRSDKIVAPTAAARSPFGAIPDPPAARPSVLLLPSTADIRRILWLQLLSTIRTRIATLPHWLLQSVGRYTASSISTSSRTANWDILPWTRVITMLFRRTWRRASCTPCMERCQTNSDRRIRAGAGNGSCSFFMLAGARIEDRAVRQLDAQSVATGSDQYPTNWQDGSLCRAVHFARLPSYQSGPEHWPLMLAIWSPYRNI